MFLGTVCKKYNIAKNEILMQKKDINIYIICVSVVEPKLPPEVNGVWMVCFGGPVRPPTQRWLEAKGM